MLWKMRKSPQFTHTHTHIRLEIANKPFWSHTNGPKVPMPFNHRNTFNCNNNAEQYVAIKRIRSREEEKFLEPCNHNKTSAKDTTQNETMWYSLPIWFSHCMQCALRGTTPTLRPAPNCELQFAHRDAFLVHFKLQLGTQNNQWLNAFRPKGKSLEILCVPKMFIIITYV